MSAASKFSFANGAFGNGGFGGGGNPSQSVGSGTVFGRNPNWFTSATWDFDMSKWPKGNETVCSSPYDRTNTFSDMMAQYCMHDLQSEYGFDRDALQSVFSATSGDTTDVRDIKRTILAQAVTLATPTIFPFTQVDITWPDGQVSTCHVFRSSAGTFLVMFDSPQATNSVPREMRQGMQNSKEVVYFVKRPNPAHQVLFSPMFRSLGESLDWIVEQCKTVQGTSTLSTIVDAMKSHHLPCTSFQALGRQGMAGQGNMKQFLSSLFLSQMKF
jgi:hypothetical protein